MSNAEIVRRVARNSREKETRVREILKRDQHAWAHSISMMLQTGGNRGVWLGGFDSGDDATDLSALGNHLGYNGNPTYNRRDFAPYLDFDGTGDYLWLADNADHDIGGNETAVAGAVQGLMVGGWFYFDQLAANEALIGKSGGAPQIAYLIQKLAANTVRFFVSVDGTAVVASPSVTITTATWYRIDGIFSPDTADDFVGIYVNGAFSSNVAGIASIFNSNAGFEISGFNAGGSQLLDGRASACGLYAMASQTFALAMFQQQRRAYGV